VFVSRLILFLIAFSFLKTIALISAFSIMETFMTQFLMSGIKTNVTIQILDENSFGFALHLSDSFEGGEMVPAKDERDGTVTRRNGEWEVSGYSKVSLSKEDLQSLGAAIEQDYSSR